MSPMWVMIIRPANSPVSPRNGSGFCRRTVYQRKNRKSTRRPWSTSCDFTRRMPEAMMKSGTNSITPILTSPQPVPSSKRIPPPTVPAANGLLRLLAPASHKIMKVVLRTHGHHRQFLAVQRRVRVASFPIGRRQSLLFPRP